jgi:hypothetical protein
MGKVTPLAKSAKLALEAEEDFCEQIRSAINSAFGCKVSLGIRVKPGRDEVNFEVTGCWRLPKDS